MTREEAIENIKLIRLNAAITNANSFREALDMAIEALSQPSIPSNLDKAAKDYSMDMGFGRVGPVQRGFKAGAGWMAGRGVSTVQFINKIPVYNKNGVLVLLHDFDGFDIGDKVIVQIRKA